MIKLEILDGMSGIGKTTGIIQWMDDNLSEKYLYTSPLFSEVERVVNELPMSEFVIPEENFNNKISTIEFELLSYLQDERNIAFTYELFRQMTEEHFNLIKEKGYILIMDEGCNLIRSSIDGYSLDDIKLLLNHKSIELDQEDFGRIHWVDEENRRLKNFAYTEFMNLCDMEMLYFSPHSRDGLSIPIPIGLMPFLKRMIVIGTRFEHSVMNIFLKMKGIDVVPFTEVKFKEFDKNLARSLIEILPFVNDKLDNISNAFSPNWYENSIYFDIDYVEKVISSICKKQKATKNDVMWTAYEKFSLPYDTDWRWLDPKPYSASEKSNGCWLKYNETSTNIYSHKWMLVHALNSSHTHNLLIYSQCYKFPIDNDELALSEVIQWIWRSRIRNNEPIKICFMAKRIENLFVNWLNED